LIQAGASVAIMTGTVEHAHCLIELLPGWKIPYLPSQTTIKRSIKLQRWLLKKEGKSPKAVGKEVNLIYPRYWDVGNEDIVTEEASSRITADILIRASGTGKHDVLEQQERISSERHLTQLVIEVT
jgi:hypothetical protein